MFSPLRLTKLYEGAVAQIFAAIRDGRLHVGDRLPPERDMATQMEVSRPSVRTALRLLADVGVLETRAGAGTFVKSDAIPIELVRGEWTTRGRSTVAQIVEAIRDGRLHVGDRLPPERDMATQMEVSRPSVRNALRLLADVGVLETRAGAGTFVKSDAIPIALLREGTIRIERLRDLLELRRLIEPRVAQVAAVHGTDQDFAAMARIIQEQREAIANRDLFLRLELQFHLGLARATQNAITPRIVELVLRQLAWLHDGALRGTESFERCIRLHEMLLDALRTRDPAQVPVAMDYHLAELESAFALLTGPESLREIPPFLLPDEPLVEGISFTPERSRVPQATQTLARHEAESGRPYPSSINSRQPTAIMGTRGRKTAITGREEKYSEEARRGG